MSYDLPNKLSFVDLETTGGSPESGGRIIEIGIIRVENGKVVSKFEQLINPEIQIPIFVQKMTGIFEEDVWAMPTFSQIKEDVLEILKNTIFVAHNVKFDYGFLKAEFKKEEIDFKMPCFCSAKLSRYLFSDMESHKLDSIMERFEIECKA